MFCHVFLARSLTTVCARSLHNSPTQQTSSLNSSYISLYGHFEIQFVELPRETLVYLWFLEFVVRSVRFVFVIFIYSTFTCRFKLWMSFIVIARPANPDSTKQLSHLLRKKQKSVVFLHDRQSVISVTWNSKEYRIETRRHGYNAQFIAF